MLISNSMMNWNDRANPKYMDAIGIHRKLTTLAQVPSLKSDIEDFISTQSGVSGKKQSYFEHFRKYVDFYDEYKGYVGTTLVEKISIKLENTLLSMVWICSLLMLIWL